jgi:hypothetical protein
MKNLVVPYIFENILSTSVTENIFIKPSAKKSEKTKIP